MIFMTDVELDNFEIKTLSQVPCDRKNQTLALLSEVKHYRALWPQLDKLRLAMGGDS